MASSGRRDFGIERAFLDLEIRVLERERQLAELENRAAAVDRQVSRLSASTAYIKVKLYCLAEMKFLTFTIP